MQPSVCPFSWLPLLIRPISSADEWMNALHGSLTVCVSECPVSQDGLTHDAVRDASRLLTWLTRNWWARVPRQVLPMFRDHYGQTVVPGTWFPSLEGNAGRSTRHHQVQLPCRAQVPHCDLGSGFRYCSHGKPKIVLDLAENLLLKWSSIMVASR